MNSNHEIIVSLICIMILPCMGDGLKDFMEQMIVFISLDIALVFRRCHQLSTMSQLMLQGDRRVCSFLIEKCCHDARDLCYTRVGTG